MRPIPGQASTRPPIIWPYLGFSLSIAILVPLVLTYPPLYKNLPEQIRPAFSFKYFMGLPVPIDQATILFITSLLSLTLLPLYIYARRGYRWREKLLEETRDFLTLYSGIIETMENAAEALLASSRLTKPPISLLAERMAHLYRIRGDIDLAFKEVFDKAPREVRLLLSSIPASVKAGGARSRVLEEAARYASQLYMFRKAIEARLAEYTAVVALAVVTYATAAAIVLGLVAAMTGSQLPLTGAARMDIPLLRGVFYYSILVLAFSSSIVIGRTIRGYMPLATKYAMILIIVSTLILVFLRIS